MPIRLFYQSHDLDQKDLSSYTGNMNSSHSCNDVDNHLGDQSCDSSLNIWVRSGREYGLCSSMSLWLGQSIAVHHRAQNWRLNSVRPCQITRSHNIPIPGPITSRFEIIFFGLHLLVRLLLSGISFCNRSART